MPSRLLREPLPGETLTVPAKAHAAPPVLDFDPASATTAREGDSLVILHANGGRVIIENFYATPDAAPPLFLVGDAEIPLTALEPAVGQEAKEVRNATLAELDVSPLLQGLNALDGLQLPRDTAAQQDTRAANAVDDRPRGPVFVNSPPLVDAAQANVTEDRDLQASGLLPQPRDPDSTATPLFTPKAHEEGRYGTLSLTAEGQYTYTLNTSSPAVQALGVGRSLTETFTYTVNDGQGGTASNTITITINGTNDVPTVAAAVAEVTEDAHTTVTGTLPAPQDVDISDSPAFLPKVETGNYGNLILLADGSYTYTLNTSSPAVQALGVGRSLTETFTYTVSDGQGGTASNTLTLTINGTNDVPTVAAAVAEVTEDTHTTVTGTLPSPQDVDISDSPAFLPKVEAGNYGNLTLLANGSYTYTLNTSSPVVQALGVGYSLTETFTYTVNDGQGGTASNTITITINGTNDVPTVAAAVAEVTEDTHTTVTGTLPAPQDVDVSDTPFFIAKTNDSGTYGALTLRADGSYTYTLNSASPVVQSLSAGQSVTESFHYTVSDGHGGYVVNSLVITVNGTNDAPVALPASATVTEDHLLTATGSLHAVDQDSLDSLTFTPGTLQGQYGSLTLQANGSYTYTLNNTSPAVQALAQGALAEDRFTYTVTDNHGATASNVLTLAVSGVNDAPTLASVRVAAAEDSLTVVQGRMAAQDVDTGDTQDFLPKVHEPGLYGSLTLGSDGSYTYSLNNSLPAVQGLGQGDTLTETFFVVVRDQHNALATSTLTVTINGTNDAPVARAFSAQVTEDLQTTVHGQLLLTDPDNTLDGQGTDTLSYTPLTNVLGAYGSLTLQTDGTYAYTLNNTMGAVQGLTTGEHLNDVFTYSVRDNHGGVSTHSLTVVVNGSNDNPLTQAATASLREDVSTLQGTLPRPTDPDNTQDGVLSDSLHFVPIANDYGAYGTLQMDASGRYTYSLNTSLPQVRNLQEGQSLRETFNYAVEDDHGGVSVNTLTLTVYGVESCKDDDDDHDGGGNGDGHGGGNGGGNSRPFVLNLNTTEDSVTQAQGMLQLSSGTSVTAKVLEGTYGTLSISRHGVVTYVLHNTLPAVQGLGAGESVQEVFPYASGKLAGQVEVTIRGTNDAPLPQVFTNTVSEDRSLAAVGSLRPVLDTDSNDVHVFTAQNGMAGQYGTLHLTNTGNYVYVLNNAASATQALGAGQTALDSFSYRVTDSAGATTQGVLRITVQGNNDSPTVADASLSLHEHDGSLSASLPIPVDMDRGDSLIFVAQQQDTAYGHISINANGGYTYVLNHSAVQSLGAGQSAVDSVAYSVSDGRGGIATAHLSITIHGDNDAPTVGAAAAMVTEDSQLTAYGQLPQPQDVDSIDIPSFVPVNYAAGHYGSLDLRASGVYTYTLDNEHPDVQALGQGESLTETFTYSVSDGKGGTAENTLTLTIHGTNDTPTVGATVGSMDMYSYGHPPASLSGTLPVADDADVRDSHAYSLEGDGQGLYGTLHVQANGTYSYTPHADSLLHGLSVGESATETFHFTVDDGHGGIVSNTLTLTITGVNDAPLAGVVNHALAVEDGSQLSGVLTLPEDPDNMGGTVHDQLSFTPQAAEGQYGSLTLHSNGSYIYTVNNTLTAVQALGEHDQLKESFTCEVSDGKGGLTTTTLEITVQGAAEPPPPAPAQLASPTSLADVPSFSIAESTDSSDMQEQILQQHIQQGN